MIVKRQQETFEPVTMGHIRSHGCRDLLVYDACARSLLPDGLHTLRDGRCRRAAGLGTACEQEARVRATGWRAISSSGRCWCLDPPA
jgi:hypothetical protein